MKCLLFQLDGKIPNIALMRIASHHRAKGDTVEIRKTGTPRRELWDDHDIVYGSAVFEKTRPAVSQLLSEFPSAIVGGTGVNVSSTLEERGITTIRQDYSDYSTHPLGDKSIGFTQRGCRLSCSFCVVPKKEGKWRAEQSVLDVWRGDPWPRELILLDNDFFGKPPSGEPVWREQIRAIREGGFKVSFNQGINARFLCDNVKDADEAAEALASVDYRADDMKTKRIYTAWDNRKDEEILFQGLRRLVRYGVRPDHIMVYMLVGYWPGETIEDCLYRHEKLRAFGCRPYPMPFTRTKELMGFQRWIVRRLDCNVPWNDFVKADYRPENLDILAKP